MIQIEDLYSVSSDKTITGTLVWYYFICKREVWLMAHEITPDEDYSALEIGRAIHEISYNKMLKEISMDGMRIDLFKRSMRTICEIKTSSKFIEAARFQLLYYLFRLREYGLNLSGWLLIPRERRRIKIELDEQSERKLLNVLQGIKEIVKMEHCPPPAKTQYCRTCAYKEFCWT